MKTSLSFNGKKLNNPDRETISKILKTAPAYYEMSLYLIKSRLKENIQQALRTNGKYQTKSGAFLVLRNNVAYLTLGGQISSLRDLNKLEKTMEKSKNEIIMQYPVYPENIKKIEMFNRMLGKAWNAN
ncbi:hypothetical protein [Candidatus Methanoperedens nitratireducens]|uniref:Uncharacterized protein n=1 Tax=Candidatus Methanoperedens nitratireducens TaxID=1392998 RepID=A0A284VKY5_9EURY|nr:hypothetical protein [Candidatus Methanoperedens nitroreducens]SNQ59869.1 hypothetical protein MNV_140004 [Candidatus Methanoperedens nitroreducens]